MSKILIIKTGCTLPALAARKGDFEDWVLAGLRVDPQRVSIADVQAGQSLPAYQAVAGVVITGSHAMVTDRHEWNERAARWLVGAVEQRLPVLGICYGHQLLAHALGGQVAKNPAGRECGVVAVHLNQAAQTDALLGGLPNPIYVHVSHEQTVLKLPANATLLASSDRDRHQAFVIEGCAWGVQFHPEFDAEINIAYINDDRQELLAEGQDPERLIATCRDTPYGSEILQRFARLALAV